MVRSSEHQSNYTTQHTNSSLRHIPGWKTHRTSQGVLADFMHKIQGSFSQVSQPEQPSLKKLELTHRSGVVNTNVHEDAYYKPCTLVTKHSYKLNPMGANGILHISMPLSSYCHNDDNTVQKYTFRIVQRVLYMLKHVM